MSREADTRLKIGAVEIRAVARRCMVGDDGMTGARFMRYCEQISNVRCATDSLYTVCIGVYESIIKNILYIIYSY